MIGIRTHVGTRHAHHPVGAARRRHVRVGRRTPLGIGRDVVLDRVIIDKNASIGDGARLVNEAGVQHADGDGYFIRGGIIIVPKGGRIAAGRHDLTDCPPRQRPQPLQRAGLQSRHSQLHSINDSVTSISWRLTKVLSVHFAILCKGLSASWTKDEYEFQTKDFSGCAGVVDGSAGCNSLGAAAERPGRRHRSRRDQRDCAARARRSKWSAPPRSSIPTWTAATC